MSMVSPMLFLLNPFDQIGSEIKCVGDMLDKIKKMKTDQNKDISVASFVVGLEYFVIDGNHRWAQKNEHLKLNEKDKDLPIWKFSPGQIFVGLTKHQTR